MQKLTELNPKGKRILVRVDWNVPFAGRTISDSFKLDASLPTINWLRSKGAKQIILLSHLGNPVVRPGERLERTIVGNRLLRLEPVAKLAAERLGLDPKEVRYDEVPDSQLPGYWIDDQLIVLENLRFLPGELTNDAAFAKELSGLGTVYVHEAFPEIHRNVASVVALPELLQSYAGLRLSAEIDHLGKLMNPPKPTVVALGGAKVEDKAPMIEQLLKKVDFFLLGGVMANTFLAAQGIELKDSLIEKERLDLAEKLYRKAPKKFILPIDFVWERGRALDIGPQTSALFDRHIQTAALTFWNGPMGWTSSGKERFAHGSEALAQSLARAEGITIAAGGDTLAVIDEYGLAEKLTFCSTGGGATMAYLSGGDLPGLDSIK